MKTPTLLLIGDRERIFTRPAEAIGVAERTMPNLEWEIVPAAHHITALARSLSMIGSSGSSPKPAASARQRWHARDRAPSDPLHMRITPSVGRGMHHDELFGSPYLRDHARGSPDPVVRNTGPITGRLLSFFAEPAADCGRGVLLRVETGRPRLAVTLRRAPSGIADRAIATFAALLAMLVIGRFIERRSAAQLGLSARGTRSARVPRVGRRTTPCDCSDLGC